jgi:L-alanine-DL-glutamate epimerase-like enolase superfamily enzyme
VIRRHAHGAEGMEEMKIDDVTLTLFAWDDIPATKYGGHTAEFKGRSHLGLLTVKTDEGVEGNAFLGSASRSAIHDASSLIQHLKPVVMGQNPLDRERLWHGLWQFNRSATLRAIGAVDIALWDIAGKVANLPVHQLMGSYRSSVSGYASSPVHQDIGAYVEEAQEIKEKGWTAYKIHPPTRWEEDIEVCKAVRKGVGDDYRVMLDSTWSYRYEEALRVGRAVEELNFYWYEDPLADDDILNYVKLKEKLDIPIMATEYAPGGHPASYAPWIVHQATDFLRGDVAVKGGLTSCLKTAHMAEGFRMNYEVHHGGNSHNNVANLHMIMAIRNCEYFEVLLPDASQKYGLVQDIEVDAAGLVHAPKEPGIGAEIDFDLIKAKTVEVLS